MRSVYYLYILMVSVAVVITATVTWMKRDWIVGSIRSSRPINKVKSTARGAWGRVEHAARVTMSNLAHTETDPEPISGN